MGDPRIAVFALMGGANLVACAVGLGYGLLVLDGDPAQRAVVVRWALSSIVLSYAVVVPLLLLGFRGLATGLARLRAGEVLPPDLLAGLRAAALELPVRLSRVSTVVWIAAAVGRLALAHGEGLDWPVLHVALATVLVGGVAATVVYYLLEWYARARIIPRLYPDGRLSEGPPVSAVPISFKLLMLLLTAVLLPIGVLTLTAAVGAATPRLTLFLGLTFAAVGLMQVAFIRLSLGLPLERLAREMARVRAGDLEARAEVASLDEVGRLAEGFNGMVAGLRQASFVRETFGRYVSAEVVAGVLAGRVALGGELRRATVLFSDIRGFTDLCEALSPDEVVRFLNRYLDLMVEAIVEAGGTVDKFVGDAIMATFGVPLAREDHALGAVRAALAMLRRLEGLNAERARAGEPPIAIGIGVHTGEVLAGNIGSAKKMEYTVIGDTVNTASRIEGLTKRLGAPLLVSGETFAEVAAHVEARPCEPQTVQGKREKLVVYEVTGEAGAAQGERSG